MEVGADDLLGAAELRKGRPVQDNRASQELLDRLVDDGSSVEGPDDARGTQLRVPQALHHELEVGRLDPVVGRCGGNRADTRLRGGDAPDGDLIEHVFDERRLDRHPADLPAQLGSDACPADELVVAVERLRDRRAALLARQPIEPQAVFEQPRDQPFEEMKPGERVLAERDEEVRTQVAVGDRPRELRGEGIVRPGVGVVDEVLLELVEDHEQLAVVGLEAPLERLDERAGRGCLAAAERRLRRVRNGLAERPDGVVAPRAEDDDPVLGVTVGRLEVVRELAQDRQDARVQHRALADAAWPVEERDASSPEVRDDHALVALPAEEEGRVLLAVRLEPDVGRLREARVHRRPGSERLGHESLSRPST